MGHTEHMCKATNYFLFSPLHCHSQLSSNLLPSWIPLHPLPSMVSFNARWEVFQTSHHR